jgi:aminoglycoside phosphotransferase (APT) family kinase protein
VDFRQQHTAEWAAYLREIGYPAAEPLGAGVEGAVYRLGDATVAKVWGHRRRTELRLLQAFYADVAAVRLPFATPVILSVDEVDGRAVTIERELTGTPLDQQLDSRSADIPPAAVDTIIEVLAGLATVPATAAMRRLPVLDETGPFRADGDDFPIALERLLERRTTRFGTVLRARVPDFDRRYDAIRRALNVLDRRSDTVLHGDLVADNIFVHPSGRPSAVLDFGFLSGAGDPRFDAAVAAAVTDMYGPHAATITESLTDRFAAALGHSADVLRLYRAAYAVATSNAFTADGSDGHFQWCIDQLTAPRTTTALRI